jgi:glucose-6-phosphate 1-dehydrogenase
MMKTDSQQLAPHMQSREAGTSDSFVFFGATGDLAYKQIFPALQQMILRDNFNLPIIGVAKSGWTIDQLRVRVRDSLTDASITLFSVTPIGRQSTGLGDAA